MLFWILLVALGAIVATTYACSGHDRYDSPIGNAFVAFVITGFVFFYALLICAGSNQHNVPGKDLALAPVNSSGQYIATRYVNGDPVYYVNIKGQGLTTYDFNNMSEGVLVYASDDAPNVSRDCWRTDSWVLPFNAQDAGACNYVIHVPSTDVNDIVNLAR